jgi:hypothetical protein
LAKASLYPLTFISKSNVMAKRRKKRVKREPKPPTWLVFKSFNQTKEEVYFGVSMTTPKWSGSKYELQGIPELKHWDLSDDKIMILKVHKRKRFHTLESAYQESRYWERTYDHWRNFWVVRTGPNAIGPQPVRKPVKPPRVPYGYALDYDMMDDFDADDIDDDLHEDEENDALEAPDEIVEN